MQCSSSLRRFFAILLFVALPCLAAVNGTDVLLPTSHRLRATVSVTNPGNETAQVQIQLLAAGASNRAPQTIDLTLAPSQTIVHENIAEALFGARGVSGAIRVHASRNVLVSSRMFTRRDDADTVWHARELAPVQDRTGLARGGSAIVDGLRSNADFHYDLTLFETSGANLVARVELRDGNGTRIGERMITLAPYDVQVLSAREILGATNVGEGSARIDVVDGDGRLAASGSLIASTFDEMAEFPMNVIENLGRGPGSIEARANDERSPLLPPMALMSIAPVQNRAATTASRRMVPNASTFTGTAQLMSSNDSATVAANSTGSASYLFRGGVHSFLVPGAPSVNVNEDDVFSVRTDGGFVAKSQNYAVFGGDTAIPATGAGIRLMWYPYRGAFRSGGVNGTQWDAVNIGDGSWAGGSNTIASGSQSFAFGESNTVSSAYGVAMGLFNSVSGTASVALGYEASVQGSPGAAIGYQVTSCSGTSVVLGYAASSSSAPTSLSRCGGTAHSGSFVFGDGNAPFFLGTVANNEFVARASGGFRFKTSNDLSTGCNLPSGSGTFNCTSDRNLKRDFEPLDGEDVLQKLAGMPIDTWSFINEKNVRHAGPAAQDFYAAFKLGTDDKSIGITDINGVALKGVQALEQRTRDLQNEVETLRAKLEKLEKLLEQR